MGRLPAWVPEDAVEPLIKTVRDRQADVETARERYLEHLADDEIDAAVSAKRTFQLAEYKRRQAEGEVLWGTLGHAIADIAETAAPGDRAVSDRGESLIEWAIESDLLGAIEDRNRVHLLIARRSPTLPSAHAPFVESMFGLGREDIQSLRERDRAMLSRAGWQRERRPGDAPVVLSCPLCDGALVVRTTEDAKATAARAVTGSSGEMREICPHCKRDIFVSIENE